MNRNIERGRRAAERARRRRRGIRKDRRDERRPMIAPPSTHKGQMALRHAQHKIRAAFMRVYGYCPWL